MRINWNRTKLLAGLAVKSNYTHGRKAQEYGRGQSTDHGDSQNEI
jgi:hypothetical protein